MVIHFSFILKVEKNVLIFFSDSIKENSYHMFIWESKAVARTTYECVV